MTLMRLHLASPVDAAAIECLEQSFEVTQSSDQAGLEDGIRSAAVLGVRSGVSVTAASLNAAKELSLIVRAGSGLDNIDLDAVRSNGIRLVRIPGPGARAVAELTLGLVLALLRNITAADRSMRAGMWAKHEMAGVLAQGRRIGIVGVGAIGSQVAALSAAVGFEVAGCVRPMNTDGRRRLLALGVEPLELPELLGTCDVVSVHVPLDDVTRHLVDAGFLGAMRRGAFLVNTSRGGVVDEVALAASLESGHLGGAALDVHEIETDGYLSPLSKFENVILTPHIGAMARDAQARIGARMVELIDAHFAGRLDAEATSHELVI